MEWPTPAMRLLPVRAAMCAAATGKSSRRYVSKSKSPNVGVCCRGAPVFGSIQSLSRLHGRLNPTPRHSTIHVSCPRDARWRAREYPGAVSNVYALEAQPGTSITGIFPAAHQCSPLSSNKKSASSHNAASTEVPTAPFPVDTPVLLVGR